MKNLEIAKIFYEIADILELQNIQWKPRAYRKAAQSLESLSEDIEEIYKEEGIKGLKEIPGVGEALAKKIIQYIETGKIREYEKLKKQIPKGLFQLMDIMGLGPKKVFFLNKNLNIKNIKDLELAIKHHKLRNLPGFGEKTEENILKGVELFKKGQERFLLGIALPIAEDIVNKLKKLKYIHKINIGGSLRRFNETIGDIDILVTSSNPEKVMDFFVKLEDVARVIAKGKTKSIVILKNGIQTDLRIVPDKSYGAALQYFTGNKEHNIKLREIAIKKGLKLSEYGLFNKKTNKLIAGKTEEEVYKKLGLKYIEPELRQDNNEIELAKKNKLPNLIQLKDIKGDFHIHSEYSDGVNRIIDIAINAKNLGYEYVCITDHSKTMAIAHGLKENDLLKQIKEIKNINKKFRNFRIFTGSEVDILSDGSLDFSDNILKKLDFVIASVHIGFKMKEKEMTTRIIKALENKYVKILGHPTGRLINKRYPYGIDIEELFKAAHEKNKFLEINGNPERLDLKDNYIKSAVENNVNLVIGTDSHNLDNLKFMEYGVAQARRGWCEKKNILNCLSLKDIKKKFNL